MKHALNLFLVLLLFSCSEKTKPKHERVYFEIADFSPEDTLFKIPVGNYDAAYDFCYVNQKGDTIIPHGQFYRSFADTIITYGMLIEKTEKGYEMIGINQQGQRLYEVHWFDFGPDFMEDGMFRILQNDKIGYADTTGKIVIPAQFDCAYPFVNGRARVTYKCDKNSEDCTHCPPQSDGWFYIDKKGQKIN